MQVELLTLTQNRQKYNQYLTNCRSDRFEQEKEEKVQKKWSLYQSKLKDMGIASKVEEKLDDEGLPENPPIDYEFETGMVDTKLTNKVIVLPESKEGLFVTRHILDYEPLPSNSQQNTGEKLNRDFREAPKRIHP